MKYIPIVCWMWFERILETLNDLRHKTFNKKKLIEFVPNVHWTSALYYGARYVATCCFTYSNDVTNQCKRKIKLKLKFYFKYLIYFLIMDFDAATQGTVQIEKIDQ